MNRSLQTCCHEHDDIRHIRCSQRPAERGMETAQAEAVAMVIQKGQGDLATKSDLDNERVELKNDINCIG